MEFLTVASLHLFAVASPGPDFALVIRQCFRYGKRSAIWTSLGISVGILFHVSLSLIGLGLLITYQPSIFNGLKILASLYILYLGVVSIFNKSILDLDKKKKSSTTLYFRSFLSGLITNTLNPKAFLFFITVFTLVISPSTSQILQGIYGLYMALATFLWFAMISIIFTNKSMTSKYVYFLPWIERIMGFILVIISIQILFY
ncbi:MAG: LysE family translocator [Pseudomonadota bacterium]|nr:LysE family translocator [Pseudomonadota bacterium]